MPTVRGGRQNNTPNNPADSRERSAESDALVTVASSTAPAPSESEPSLHLPGLVVVGASAGGVEALSTLVSTLPDGFPAPVVLAQHLDPNHPSHLGEILARYSRLPVQTVSDEAPLEAATIYVIPADCHVEVTDHVLHLHADGEGKRPKPSINLLFSSAAQVFGERLIAVILTGTGSDGASGAYEVKTAGGIVIIENPETAAYPALPASLAPSTVDFVVDLERIGPLLFEILTSLNQPTQSALLANDSASQGMERQEQGHGQGMAQNEPALQHLLNHVRERSNIDFSQYKVPTIVRRLQRRMFATGTRDLAGYQKYLESHPDEYSRLVGSFLIKVTGFFRDPELFAVLQERVLPDLIAHARTRGNVLRIWSAGCATGEEAYSLAVLVAEALGEELDQFSVQIFATDVDEDAIEFARHGIYPEAALSGVTKQRREQYFQRLDGTYQITKALRGLVIFGVHDLGLRAAFPHIDLVVCRNVLMYFTKELQARSLQLFAFSLRNDGYLALGNAETTKPLRAYFDQVSSSLKLYRRQGDRVVGPVPTSESLQTLVTVVARSRPHPPSYIRARADATSKRLAQQDTLLQNARNSRERLGLLLLGLPIWVVVIDRRYDIQIINEVAMRLLGIFTEPLGEDLIHLAQSIPSSALRAVIDAAFRGIKESTLQPVVARQQPAPTEVNDFGDHLEGVITVETLLGERRNLQFTCFAYAPQQIVHDVDLGEVEARQGPVHLPTHTPVDARATPPRARVVPLVLILIRDVTAMVRVRGQASHAAAEERAQSQAEQARARSELETTVEQLQHEITRLTTEIGRQGDINRTLLEGNQKLAAANLALRATNEELQVSEEEAEASTEEVKTLNEELQATNEELVTVNEELEATVEELHAANEELEARTRELQEMTAAQRTRGRGENKSEQSTE